MQFKLYWYTLNNYIFWLKHFRYLQVEFSMISLQVLDEESAADLVSAINQDEEDKSIIGKSQNYMQSCSNLLKFIENKSKIKITE